MAVQPRRSSSPSTRRSADSALPLVPGIRASREPAEMREVMPLSGSRDSRSSPAADLMSSRASATPYADHLDEDSDLRIAEVPLTGNQKMIIDDQNATYVIIFPRQKDEDGDGAIHLDAVRENPRADWQKIFKHSKERKEIPPEVRSGSMREVHFQELVRMHFLDFLKESGLKAATTESIDKDETFLRLSLDRDGATIRHLAKSFQYRMPFKSECYKSLPLIGCYPGGRPMKNEEGEEVLAYQEYDEQLEGHLQPFRRTDEIRLILMQLETRVSLHQMREQNIISGHFPGADYDTVMKLHAGWAQWQNAFLMPSVASEGEVRDYFGEEIALFFRWTGMYTRMLGSLSLVSLCALLRYLPDLGLTKQARDFVKLGFGFMIVLWETYFRKLNMASSARAVQFWGMDSWDTNEPALPSFEPKLEGTQALRLRKDFAAAAVIFYMVFVMFIIYRVNRFFYEAALDGQDQYAAFQSTVQSILIKVLSFVWRKISFYLVLMQNHRTQSRFNNALITNIALVKLFVALYPFLYSSALRIVLEGTCEDSLSMAAHSVYGPTGGWPGHVQINVKPGSNEYIPMADLDFLKRYYYINQRNKTCILGCYPVDCSIPPDIYGAEPQEMQCITNCIVTLQDSLRTLYVIQLASSMIFVLIPIFLTRRAVQREMRKAERISGRAEAYSFIQLQAKCHREAPYEFSSWGGSYVEDFLDLAVTYSLLACFGMCYPTMAIIGFVCMLVQYRLLAYRMAIVTCRPEPRGSSGLGLVATIFEVLSVFSVFFNAFVGVFVMLPMTTQELYFQIVVFIVVEKATILLRGVISYLIPGIPTEVTLIQDFNDEFKKAFNKRKLAHSTEKRDLSGIDVGLRRPGDDGDVASTDSDSADSAQGAYST